VQRLLEEAAAATQQRGQLETQLDAARAATAAARLEHETTKVLLVHCSSMAAAWGAQVLAVCMHRASVSWQRGWYMRLLA
jgi:hypothetical protein